MYRTVLELQRTHLQVLVKQSVGIHWLQVVIPLPLREAGLGVGAVLSPELPPRPPVLDQPDGRTTKGDRLLLFSDLCSCSGVQEIAAILISGLILEHAM